MLNREFYLEKYLLSGITLKIENYSDLILYQQIFLEAEYDFAIQKSFNFIGKQKALDYLDIGANLGFFTLRILDLLIINFNKIPNNLNITCVEGSPSIFNLLKSRMQDYKKLDSQLKIIHGLVGRREGKGQIFEFGFHAINSMYLSKEARDFASYTVPFIDLSNLFNSCNEINLLKCDIEGAELEFLENYQDLMEKVKYAVFEFHYDLCDVEKCFAILQKLGFSKQTLLKTEQLRSVVFFER